MGDRSFGERAQILIEKARAGTLTEAEFYDLAGLVKHPQWDMVMTKWMLEKPAKPTLDDVACSALLRETFIRQVSFAVFTTGYLDSLARLVKGQRVLEVCARTGVLGPLMEDRGIDWFCTDINPQAHWVECADALKAVKTWRPDVVFASWIDYGFDLDQQLAERVPCVFVAESCTGTTESGFYDNPNYEVTRIRAFPWFQDVPNWGGIRDRTVVTVPKGQSSPFRA